MIAELDTNAISNWCLGFASCILLMIFILRGGGGPPDDPECPA